MKQTGISDGNVLRVARVLKGYSQRKLGLAAGIRPARVFKIESGLSAPRAEELQKLWSALSSEAK